MAIIEVVIFHKGIPLYFKKYDAIRDIEDDDVVSTSIYAMFLRLQESLSRDSSKDILMKMELDRHVLHVWKKNCMLQGTQEELEMFIYVIEDRNIDDEKLKPILGKILDSFLEHHGKEIDTLKRSKDRLSAFDVELEKILGPAVEKVFLRFFNTWDAPRLDEKVK